MIGTSSRIVLDAFKQTASQAVLTYRPYRPMTYTITYESLEGRIVHMTVEAESVEDAESEAWAEDAQFSSATTSIRSSRLTRP